MRNEALMILELALRLAIVTKKTSAEDVSSMVLFLANEYHKLIKILRYSNETNEIENDAETDDSNADEIINLIKKYAKKSKYNDCTKRQRQLIYKLLGRSGIKLNGELKSAIQKLDKKLASKIIDTLEGNYE